MGSLTRVGPSVPGRTELSSLRDNNPGPVAHSEVMAPLVSPLGLVYLHISTHNLRKLPPEPRRRSVTLKSFHCHLHNSLWRLGLGCGTLMVQQARSSGLVRAWTNCIKAEADDNESKGLTRAQRDCESKALGKAWLLGKAARIRLAVIKTESGLLVLGRAWGCVYLSVCMCGYVHVLQWMCVDVRRQPWAPGLTVHPLETGSPLVHCCV